MSLNSINQLTFVMVKCSAHLALLDLINLIAFDHSLLGHGAVWSTSARFYYTVYQKVIIFIVAAVRTSNLTSSSLFLFSSLFINHTVSRERCGTLP
jgi:hypothetical protein